MLSKTKQTPTWKRPAFPPPPPPVQISVPQIRRLSNFSSEERWDLQSQLASSSYSLAEQFYLDISPDQSPVSLTMSPLTDINQVFLRPISPASLTQPFVPPSMITPKPSKAGPLVQYCFTMEKPVKFLCMVRYNFCDNRDIVPICRVPEMSSSV
ncbi:hypothetical protein nvc1_152 [Namao virus]|nr:hypothetical protein nvc1_152 [Namao virus]